MAVLHEGDVDVKGRMPWSSNGTFLVSLCRGDDAMDAIYKPLRGERGLWDFPDGLYRREVAAYVLSEALGWRIVPETVARHDAPYGEGSLQRFVPSDFSQHYFTLFEDEAHHATLQTIGAFDLLANNADRKSGHCLMGDDGRIWAIDHGVTFNVDPKLRTVIWEFAGEPIPANLLADIAALARDLPDFSGLLMPSELAALSRRAEAVLRMGEFPEPRGERAYPWPLV